MISHHINAHFSLIQTLSLAVAFNWKQTHYVTRTFEERIEDLRAFKKKHGHVDVKVSDDACLGQFCANAR